MFSGIGRTIESVTGTPHSCRHAWIVAPFCMVRSLIVGRFTFYVKWDAEEGGTASSSPSAFLG